AQAFSNSSTGTIQVFVVFLVAVLLLVISFHLKNKPIPETIGLIERTREPPSRPLCTFALTLSPSWEQDHEFRTILFREAASVQTDALLPAYFFFEIMLLSFDVDAQFCILLSHRAVQPHFRVLQLTREDTILDGIAMDSQEPFIPGDVVGCLAEPNQLTILRMAWHGNPSQGGWRKLTPPLLVPEVAVSSTILVRRNLFIPECRHFYFRAPSRLCSFL
ncbi:hypothetical protein L0F63_003006, partial [Massospora cicadina]